MGSEKTSISVAKNARNAFLTLQTSTTDQRNDALVLIKQALDQERNRVFNANEQDKKLSKEALVQNKISEATYKRLDIQGKDNNKYQQLLQGVQDVISLEDPLGQVTLSRLLDDGLELYRVTCPIGVICIIFEARPEVVVQISCLTIKSGNAVILKGGSEAHNSNEILVSLIREALSNSQLPVDAVQLVSSREEIKALLALHNDINLLIPRGSKSMIDYIRDNTKIPVLGHSEGICSVYVDSDANLETAMRVIIDSKTNYPAACNACETVLVHQSVVSKLLPLLSEACRQHGIRIHADAETIEFFAASDAVLAIEADFAKEFSDMEMVVKQVLTMEEAVQHINHYGSHHTDCIVTENKERATVFMSSIDSAGVYCNCSTRFADGFRYGFGAEIGISTNKIGARGPVGLDGLLSYKYWMYGQNHVVSDYGTLPGQRQFKHAPLAPTQFPLGHKNSN